MARPRFIPGPFVFQGLTWTDGQIPIPRISRDHRLRAACGGIRLHTRETPVTCVHAGQPGFQVVVRVPPAGFEPAAHGLGNHWRSSYCTRSDLRSSVSTLLVISRLITSSCALDVPCQLPLGHVSTESPDTPARLEVLVARDEKSSLPTILTDLVDRGQYLRVGDRDIATVTPPKVQSPADYPVTASPVANNLYTVIWLRVHPDDHEVEWAALVPGPEPVRPTALAVRSIVRSCVPLGSHRPIIASATCQAYLLGLIPSLEDFEPQSCDLLRPSSGGLWRCPRLPVSPLDHRAYWHGCGTTVSERALPDDAGVSPPPRHRPAQATAPCSIRRSSVT
jgi:hypothetical protein